MDRVVNPRAEPIHEGHAPSQRIAYARAMAAGSKRSSAKAKRSLVPTAKRPAAKKAKSAKRPAPSAPPKRKTAAKAKATAKATAKTTAKTKTKATAKTKRSAQPAKPVAAKVA